MASSPHDLDVQLHQNGDYWLARWRDSSGKRKSRSLGKRKDAGGDVSERKAKRDCSKIQTDLTLEPGRRDAGGNATLGWWCDRYIATRTDIGPKTRLIHLDTIGYLRRYFDDDKRLDRITKSDATDWRVWMTKQPRRQPKEDEDPDTIPRMSETTVCKHVRTCKTIINHAIEEGHVGVNVFSHLKGKAPKLRRSKLQLTPEDIQRLVDAAPSPAWRALIGLCAWAGLRRGEAMRLRWSDIKWDRRRLEVRLPERVGEGTKLAERDVLLERRLEQLLLEVHQQAQPGTELVAPVPFNNLHRNMVAIVERAGLPKWQKPYHALRGWRASTWRKKYPEPIVDAWLGHSMEVARDHYVAVPESYYQDASDEDDPRDAEIAILRKRLRRVIALARAAQNDSELAQTGAQKSPGRAGANS